MIFVSYLYLFNKCFQDSLYKTTNKLSKNKKQQTSHIPYCHKSYLYIDTCTFCFCLTSLILGKMNLDNLKFKHKINKI